MAKRTLKTAEGHALGLSGTKWAEAWVAKCKDMSLDAAKDRCLLPAVDPFGQHEVHEAPIEIA